MIHRVAVLFAAVFAAVLVVWMHTRAGFTSRKSLPSDILDLSTWKLTLPIAGADGKAEALSSADLRSHTSQYMFVTGSQRRPAVAFKAPCNGFTTENTKYPRSELGEIDKNGEKRIWSNRRGTHVMSATLAIAALPPVKPHVICAQIHGSTEAPLTIRLEGPTLIIEHYGATKLVLNDAYALGELFTIIIRGAKGKFTVTYRGKNGTKSWSMAFPLDWCRFRIGCYLASNVEAGNAPDAYGQVNVFSLRTVHTQ